MITVIAFIILTTAVFTLIAGFVVEERDERHEARHEAATEASRHTPTTWPGYDSNCGLCNRRR